MGLPFVVGWVGGSGLSEFDVPVLPKLPEAFGVGLIVGPSGSGKTTILSQRFG